MAYGFDDEGDGDGDAIRNSLWQWLAGRTVRHNVETITKLAGLCTIFGGLLTYCSAKDSEELNRENAAYVLLTEEYSAFERLCIQYPNLDCADEPMSPPPCGLSQAQLTQQKLLWTSWLSLIEVFVRYDQTHQFKGYEGARDGWLMYMADYLRRPALRAYIYGSAGEFAPALQCEIRHVATCMKLTDVPGDLCDTSEAARLVKKEGCSFVSRESLDGVVLDIALIKQQVPVENSASLPCTRNP